MSDIQTTTQNPAGWRILGVGKEAGIAAMVQERLRSRGYRATVIGVTDDAAGDASLVAALTGAEWDGVTIGSGINGQDAVALPATDQTTRWFNRLLNIIHSHAPKAKIILLRGPSDAVPAIERELGPNP
jgi:hypothetical protein